MMDKLLNRCFDREEGTLAQQRVMSNRWCQWNPAFDSYMNLSPADVLFLSCRHGWLST